MNMSHSYHIKQLTIYNLTAKSITYNTQGMPTIWPGKVNLSEAAVFFDELFGLNFFLLIENQLGMYPIQFFSLLATN